MKLKLLIVFVFVHLLLMTFETFEWLVTREDTSESSFPAVLQEFVDAYSEENLDFTLDIWSDDSFLGTVTDAIGSTYRLVTFSGYQSLLGEGSGALEGLRPLLLLYGHIMMIAIVWHLIWVPIRPFVSFSR